MKKPAVKLRNCPADVRLSLSAERGTKENKIWAPYTNPRHTKQSVSLTLTIFALFCVSPITPQQCAQPQANSDPLCLIDQSCLNVIPLPL